MNRSMLLLAAIAAMFGGVAAVQSLRAHNALADKAALQLELAQARATSAPPPKKDAHAILADDDDWEPDVRLAESAEGHPDAADEEPFMASVIDAAVQSMMSEDGTQAGGKSGGKKAGKASGKDGASGTLTPEERKQRHADKLAARGEESSNPESARLVKQATKLMKSGNYEEAQALLEQSLEKDPKNRQAWKTLAMLQHQTGMAEAELQTYQDWMDAMPNDAVARYLAAQAFARNGMDGQARQYLAEFQSMSQGDLRAYPMIADMYRQMGMRAEEGAALQQWVQSVPDSTDAHRLMGDYYRRMGDAGGALAEYQTLAALQPGSSSTYVQMGNVYRQTGDYASAIAQYQTALDLRPGSTATLNRLADVQRLSGDLTGAAATYTQVLSMEPGSRATATAAAQLRRIERQLNPPVPAAPATPKP